MLDTFMNCARITGSWRRVAKNMVVGCVGNTPAQYMPALLSSIRISGWAFPMMAASNEGGECVSAGRASSPNVMAVMTY
jgi:hypothetical protein